jgi:predicted MFS family arabinose efflux permease
VNINPLFNAQAIYSTATFGLASITALIGGYLYDNVGMQNFFRIFSLLGLAGLAIFLMAGKHKFISVGVGEKR